MQKILKISKAHRARRCWTIRLFPFTATDPDAPKMVVIDPRISFGHPSRNWYTHSHLAERYKAGESIDDLANDYDCSRFQIEEGIRCELLVAA